MDTLPTVGVVLATHNRPGLMRLALASILEQDYDGVIDVVLVYDRCDLEPELARHDASRRVQVISNSRTPGLAGARNTGILALDTELVAFCDDDDTWLPGKLVAQVRALQRVPEAILCTTAMQVDFRGELTVRLAGAEVIRSADVTRSRMAMLHSSSFLFRRAALTDESRMGLVNEDLPRSMAEDWDVLLRAAKQGPIANVDEPLVNIVWGASSYFNEAWKDKNEAHRWLVETYPEMLADKVGAGLMLGKLAFGHAALGNRRDAVRYAARGIRVNWKQPRPYLALAVLAGVSPDGIQSALNRRGHGI